jgi:hypothetical protein
VVVVVLLIMLIITITEISSIVTEVHDGIYRVVILCSSLPQLSQHTRPIEALQAIKLVYCVTRQKGQLQHNWCT